MAWKIEFTPTALREFAALDKPIQKRIADFIENRLIKSDDPRSLAIAMSGDFAGMWQFRVGDYRIVCEIKADVLLVVVIHLGHRREVYR